jgi:hypothetical protein
LEQELRECHQQRMRIIKYHEDSKAKLKTLRFEIAKLKKQLRAKQAEDIKKLYINWSA